jgi:Uma2 family endonuclease
MKQALDMATTSTMAGAQFDALPYEEGRKWELLEGELIAAPSPTPEHQLIVSTFCSTLRQYFQTSPIGAALPDVEFALNESTRLRPDVCVLLHARWTNLDRRRIPIPGAPDIAIEIISPSERTADSTRKVWTYLRAGVEEVWQIYPQPGTVVIYASNAPMRVLTERETLTSPLLPDWELSIHYILA